MAVSKEQLEELEAKYGRIAHIKGPPLPGKTGQEPSKEPSWEVVLRKPRRAEYKVYRAQSKDTADAQEYLVLKTCVYPSTPEAIDMLFDEYPAIPEACGTAITRLVGLVVEADSK